MDGSQCPFQAESAELMDALISLTQDFIGEGKHPGEVIACLTDVAALYTAQGGPKAAAIMTKSLQEDFPDMIRKWEGVLQDNVRRMQGAT